MWGLIEEALENVRVELFPQEIETCGLDQGKGLEETFSFERFLRKVIYADLSVLTKQIKQATEFTSSSIIF